MAKKENEQKTIHPYNSNGAKENLKPRDKRWSMTKCTET